MNLTWLNNIYKHPFTSIVGVIIGVGCYYSHTILCCVAVVILGLVAKDPTASR